MPATKVLIIRQCKVCGDNFRAKTLDSWYCSKKCSNTASKRKADMQKRQQLIEEAIAKIDPSKDMITIAEAVLLFEISKETVRRLVHKGSITSVNAGIRKILVSKTDLFKICPLRTSVEEKEKPIPKTYRMEPEDCYVIGEISKKYKLDDSTVWAHIRKYSIPSRQIGNFVYVPKREIDELYKDIKL